MALHQVLIIIIIIYIIYSRGVTPGTEQRHIAVRDGGRWRAPADPGAGGAAGTNVDTHGYAYAHA